jgi:hypothetical protein
VRLLEARFCAGRPWSADRYALPHGQEHSFHTAVEKHLQVSNAPRKAAVDTDGSDRAIFQTGPFSEGLSFAIKDGSGLVRG